ncbi:unnamed protein product [Caenorhabditis angaria]|uniref:ABC transporter domain-containing protein n=1 Tax=Caenorhabditis angaria TaxID=860376 RepID=A0A9P1IGF2_9PELO|nr:unnamed protein product [Caenorhabditis angaria]
MLSKFRQFWILLQKDAILLRRNRLWTFLEVVLPFLFLVLLVFVIYAISPGDQIPSQSARSFELFGGIDDTLELQNHRWCKQSKLKLAYVTKSKNPQRIQRIMENLGKRYIYDVNLTSIQFPNEEEMMKNLKMNLADYCAINDFVGGIVFDETRFEERRKVLKYRFFMRNYEGDQWNLNRNWIFPYGWENGTTENLYPIYLESGFLSLQHALESSFVDENPPNNFTRSMKPISFHAFDTPSHQQKLFATSTLYNLPAILPIVLFVNVLHITRQISAEISGVKPFLRALGLSTPWFYFTHIFVGFLKFSVVLVAMAQVLMNIQHLNRLLFIIVISLYGIGSLTFGALIASLFKTPNSGIKAIVIIWPIISALGVFISIDDSSEFLKCFYFSLNFNGAFYIAIHSILKVIYREKPYGFLNLFDSSSGFPLGFSILMMMFDIIWMFLLTLILDAVRNSEISFSWKREKKQAEVPLDVFLQGSNELDQARIGANAGISVKKLVKTWSNGEKGVDGMSFEAKMGQVSVLLGHNGAGKSTTFQSIAGIIKPSSGKISISGGKVGFCPQYNPLYDNLTIEEHLWLVNGLKGNRDSGRGFQEEMVGLLSDVKLYSKKYEISKNLSGGMKRKLCVCMALIGSSEVVLLDEPTAGMDPGARKDVQDLLEREKQNRTILLTTHYMDEAERLGDWILIMSHGKLVSSGTPKFLKQKYGTGYLLTVVLGQKGNKDRMRKVLEEICKFYIPESSCGDLHGQQLQIVLTESWKNQFPNLFKAIEAIQENDFGNAVFSGMPVYLLNELITLDMTSFGLSLNTLEQVFITIGEKVEEIITSRKNMSIKEVHENSQSSEKYKRLMESHEYQQASGFHLITSQITAIFRKKYLYLRRKWAHLIGQIVLPIIIFAILGTLETYKMGGTESSRSLSLDLLTPTSFIVDQYGEKFAEALTLQKKSGFEEIKFDGDVTKFMIETYGMLPAVGFGFGIEEDDFEHPVIYYNSRNIHILPALVSLINTAKYYPNQEDVTIEARIHLFSLGHRALAVGSASVAASFLIILILAILISSFVMFQIEERVSRFAHQQFLSGISPITFYGASLLFDFLMFSGVCLIFIAMFIYWNWMEKHLLTVLLFWMLYFFSCIPTVYSLSLLLQSPSKANVFLVIWQIISPGIVGIIVLIKTQITHSEDNSTLLDVCSFFFPSFAFGRAILRLNENVMLSNQELMSWDNLGKLAMFMGGFSMVTLMCFVGLQSRAIRKFIAKTFVRKQVSKSTHLEAIGLPKCVKIHEEVTKARTANVTDYAMIIKDLTKQYGKSAVVDNLCLTVEKGECFGLLGINGAGKTSTFNILTGEGFATSGEARIGGIDVADRIQIGYCPQFDALLLDLTGREVLEILGQMHGFLNYRDKANIILDCVGMQKQSNKLCRYYSGGQKRKISIGIALLSTNSNSMIILDEPTAGIDPKARREIWELLIWSRQQQNDGNSAIMLTSHSMDECEALCSRIAVLNQGKLIAIGTSQELKSLYGNNYTMTLTLNDSKDRENIVNAIKNQIPGAILRTPESNKTLNIVWLIPKNLEDKWSDKFEMVQNLARQLNVKDYILAQSSLEETFLRLAGVNQENLVDV